MDAQRAICEGDDEVYPVVVKSLVKDASPHGPQTGFQFLDVRGLILVVEGFEEVILCCVCCKDYVQSCLLQTNGAGEPYAEVSNGPCCRR